MTASLVVGTCATSECISHLMMVALEEIGTQCRIAVIPALFGGIEIVIGEGCLCKAILADGGFGFDRQRSLSDQRFCR